MADKLALYGVQYTVYAAELTLVAAVLWRQRWKRLLGLLTYAAMLLLTDSVARSFVCLYYGEHSKQYGYFYYLTDVVLALGAFLLVCSFFRRACVDEEKTWTVLRLFLISVFILVLGISLVSITRNYGHLFTSFIIEFEQNLYFTCLVLNTFLYLLLQKLESRDEELGLLVCGMGIQFAGPAAGWALVHLTSGDHFSQSLQKYIVPLCTLGMLLTWFYAVARVSQLAMEEREIRDGQPVPVRTS